LSVSSARGGAAAGLRALRAAPPAKAGTRGAARRLAARHLVPPDRLALGLALAEGRLASACMDLSDGLATDLPRLCHASGAGAEVRAEALPVDADARALHPREAESLALHGGEDYELLFAVPPAKRQRVLALGGRLGVALTEIGRFTRRRGVMLVKNGRRVPFRPGEGFSHF
jgi:thiamine-monophosphate kinase